MASPEPASPQHRVSADAAGGVTAIVGEIHVTAAKLRHLTDIAHQLEAAIAATEIKIAATFRNMAAAATLQGRAADATRLIHRAEHAERFAELEQQRANKRQHE